MGWPCPIWLIFEQTGIWLLSNVLLVNVYPLTGEAEEPTRKGLAQTHGGIMLNPALLGDSQQQQLWRGGEKEAVFSALQALKARAPCLVPPQQALTSCRWAPSELLAPWSICPQCCWSESLGHPCANGQRTGKRLSGLGFNQLVPPPGPGEPQWVFRTAGGEPCQAVCACIVS